MSKYSRLMMPLLLLSALLTGPAYAREVQRYIQYDPEPPYKNS